MANDRKILYYDMDGTLCAYHQAMRIARENSDILYPQSVPGFFKNLSAIDGAIDTFNATWDMYDVYILTAPSIMNPLSYAEKRIWVEENLGMRAAEKLIISPNKALSIGDYLIDDMDKGRGQDKFAGELIHFGSETFPTWKTIKEYLGV